MEDKKPPTFEKVAETCLLVTTLIEYFETDRHPCFNGFVGTLCSLDLKKKFAKFKQLLTEFKEQEESGIKYPLSIKMEITDLFEVITETCSILDQTQKLQEYQKLKWFNTWEFRFESCLSQTEQIKSKAKLFSDRFNDLVRTTTIVRNLR